MTILFLFHSCHAQTMNIDNVGPTGKKNKSTAQDSNDRAVRANVAAAEARSDASVELDALFMSEDEGTLTYTGGMPNAMRNPPAVIASRLDSMMNPAAGVLRAGSRTLNGPLLANPAAIADGRAQLQLWISQQPENERGRYAIRVNPVTGRVSIFTKPLPVESDPFIVEQGSRIAAIRNKVNSMLPQLTGRQQAIIKAMEKRATERKKRGKPGVEAKLPTIKQLDKILFRALEFFSARRAAQLNAQARAARTQRHGLQNHKTTVALADGRTVNRNKRWLKKRASQARIADAVADAKVAAAADRAVLTARNKANRVAIATSHGRKVNKKDLPPGTSVAPARGITELVAMSQ